VDEVKDIRDKAVAMQAYAQQANDKEFLSWAAEIRLRAETRAGILLKEMDKNTGEAGQFTGGDKGEPPAPPTLTDMGVTKKQSSQWQKLANIDEEVLEEYIAATEVPTATALLGKKTTIATLHTGDNESYTPAKYVEAARQVLGGIHLDPASNSFAQKVIQAEIWYGEEDDGLTKNWEKTVFVNPPYAYPAIAHFVDKLCVSVGSGAVDAAVLLTNNSTDTKWWHKGAEYATAVCFTAGRINFYKADDTTSSPTNGQTFFYFGHKDDEFKAVFQHFGLVLKT
jgi:hypothetical protein